MKRREKRLYDLRGYEGMDVSNEISLFEYGFLCRLNKKKDEAEFWYAVEWEKYRAVGFQHTYMTRKDWLELVKEDWAEAESVAASHDQTAEVYLLPEAFPERVIDFVWHHGAENIFGSCYEEPRKISGDTRADETNYQK